MELEEFKSYLLFIRDKRVKQDEFIEALEKLSPGDYCNCFLYSDYESKIIDLLRIVFKDKNDDIGYFIYDLDGLKNKNLNIEDKSRCPIDEDGNLLYYSADTLYDYLMRD